MSKLSGCIGMMMPRVMMMLVMSKDPVEEDGDDDDGSDIKHVEDVLDGGQRDLDTVMGAAGEATENTLSGMGGQ